MMERRFQLLAGPARLTPIAADDQQASVVESVKFVGMCRHPVMAPVVHHTSRRIASGPTCSAQTAAHGGVPMKSGCSSVASISGRRQPVRGKVVEPSTFWCRDRDQPTWRPVASFDAASAALSCWASLNFCTLPVVVRQVVGVDEHHPLWHLELGQVLPAERQHLLFGHDGTGCENDDDTADLASAIVDQPDGEHLADVLGGEVFSISLGITSSRRRLLEHLARSVTWSQPLSRTDDPEDHARSAATHRPQRHRRLRSGWFQKPCMRVGPDDTSSPSWSVPTSGAGDRIDALVEDELIGTRKTRGRTRHFGLPTRFVVVR